MVTLKEIQDYASSIASKFNPEKIILFGSYANGLADDDSDVDLLVVIPCKENPTAKAVEIRLGTGTRFPMDIIVRDPIQMASRIRMGDSFLRDIMSNGKLLYESPHH